MTVVEVIAAVAILGVVAALAGATFVAALNAGRTATRMGQVRNQAERLVQRIARDIRYSSTSSDGWDFPAGTAMTAISFSQCTGWDASTKERTWGPVIRYRWAIDDAGGETDDGVDNNGNGVVDEGNVFMRRATGVEVLIGRNVERGSLLLLREDVADGSLITIRAAVALPHRTHKGSVARGVYETTVALRN